MSHDNRLDGPQGQSVLPATSLAIRESAELEQSPSWNPASSYAQFWRLAWLEFKRSGLYRWMKAAGKIGNLIVFVILGSSLFAIFKFFYPLLPLLGWTTLLLGLALIAHVPAIHYFVKFHKRTKAELERGNRQQLAERPILGPFEVAADPNIHAGRSEKVFVTRDARANIIESRDDTRLKAITIVFTNKPHASYTIGGISGVSAVISYAAYDETAFSLNDGVAVWLSEVRHDIPFPVDASQLLVIALEDQETKDLYGVQRVSAELGPSVRDTILKGDLFRVRVSVRSGTKVLRQEDYMVERDGRKYWEADIFAGTHILPTKFWRYGQILTAINRAYEFKNKDESDDYKSWEATMASLITRHYGEREKNGFLIDSDADESPRWFRALHPLPTSFHERIDRQIEILRKLEKQPGL